MRNTTLTILLLLAWLGVSLGQNNPIWENQTITTSGTSWTLRNSNGAMSLSIAEQFTGTPSTVSIVIQGCSQGVSGSSTTPVCETIDTYTTVTDAIRSPTLSKPYYQFIITASWTGGSSPTVVFHSTATIARNGSGGGSGSVTSIATTSPITGGTITSTGTIGCATCTTSSASLTNNAFVTGAALQGLKTPSATSTLDSSGNASFAGSVTASSDGVHAGAAEIVGNTTVPTLNSNTFSLIGPNSASFTSWGIQMASAENASAGIFHVGAASSHISQGTVSLIVATDMAAQYSKGSCTEVWGGSGTSFAMTSGDDAISNNSCYNDSGVTRTITAVKCRSDNAANTTVLTPTFGAAGTGTAILTGTLTCGNSYAYSATGTLANTAWTTGTGVDPGMSTVGNATSAAMIIEYTF